MVMHDERIYSQNPAVLASAFDPGVGGSLHTDFGFQYPFFLIEGDELLVTVRTAFCDGEGGAPAGHDADYYFFNLRTKSPNHKKTARHSKKHARTWQTAPNIFTRTRSFWDR